MATKYAGQNALNKLMQIIKAAIDAKADKSALDVKLDKTGGTMTGDLTVSGAYITAKCSDNVGGDIKADRAVSAFNFIIDTGAGDKMAIFKTGDTAAAFRSTPGADYIRFAVGTPTGDNDAATKAYVDSKVASGGVTVDSSVSSTSTNPVQNKAIKAELDKKLNKTGGTVGGNLVVDGSLRTGTFSATNLGIYTSDLSHGVTLTCDDGSSASLAGEAEGTYARLSVGTPTGGNDATTKDYVDNKVSGLQTADQVRAAISSAITGVYTPKGSIAFKSLPTAAAGNKGWVYNVSDAFTTTAEFVEGAGHSYGAGTNVVCVDAGSGSYKWDVLAGTVDLTELTADEVQTLWNSI